MNITVRDHEHCPHVDVQFGRRAGVSLHRLEAEVLRRQLEDYLELEIPCPDIDVGVGVREGIYSEDHLQVLVHGCWFELTTKEAFDLKDSLDSCLVS